MAAYYQTEVLAGMEQMQLEPETEAAAEVVVALAVE